METVYEWGLGIIRAIQVIENPVISIVMHGITELGSKYAYLALLPLLFWCYDEKKGLKLAVLVLVSAWLNGWIKVVLQHPRPYNLDPSVGKAFEPSFGNPSGHAQGSLVFWAVIGSWIKKPGGIIIAVAVPLLIAFTRLYLGVHFPTDLFLGWILGGLLLVLYFKFSNLISSMLINMNIRFRILIAALAAFIMNALHPEDTSLGGVFFGMCCGYILMRERFPFSAALAADGGRPRLPVLGLRYLVGIAGAGILYFGLSAIFPGSESSWYDLGRFIRYALVGAWVAAGAPWVFLRLGLAGSAVVAENPES